MSGDGYESGDVNTVGAGDSFDEDVEEAGVISYEDGDVNTVPGGASAQYDDEFEGDDDVDDANDDESGNAATSGTSEAVLRYLARSLADEPDEVIIRTEDRRGTVVLRLNVAPGDMGRVIGRRGRTAQAIRTLVGAAGARDGVQTSVDIVDD